MQETTCPLDCFDSCGIVYNNTTLKGNKNHPITEGFLCSKLNGWFKYPRIKTPLYNGKEITLQEAFSILVKQLQVTKQDKTLFYKGSGNLGFMQNITKLFFASHKSVVAKGSLCDGAGDAGITLGRGANLPLSPLHVKNSEVVILWGRDPSVTNSHVLKALKGKKLIVINPLHIDLAKNADIFIPIKPRGDIYFAMLLARVAYMEELEDKEFIRSRCDGFEDFIDLICSIPIVKLMEKCGLTSLESIGDILYAIKNKKVCVLVGVGVQKYSFGHQVLQAIDSFGAMMGLFGKEGCGVGFLGDSTFGFKSSFKTKTRQDSVVNADFSKYDLVFVQGGNPALQMPNSLHVRKNLAKTQFLVYFGLHENFTSKMANLVIPAKSFLAKEDCRGSYGHEFVGLMPKLIEEEYGVSEYELTCKLMEHFGYETLRSEEEYIESFLGDNTIKQGNFLINKQMVGVPYEDGFFTQNGKFHFLDELDDDFEEEEGFYLISAKNKKSLNSQFSTNDVLHVPTKLGLKDKERILLICEDKKVEYEVLNDVRLRDDCFLLYSGAQNLNALTPSHESYEGNCAIFGELKVQWRKI